MKKNLLDSLTIEDKTIMLSENVGHESPNDAALCPRISEDLRNEFLIGPATQCRTPSIEVR